MTVTINSLEQDDSWRLRVGENLKIGNDVILENFNYDLHWQACETLSFVHGVQILLNGNKDECHFRWPISK